MEGWRDGGGIAVVPPDSHSQRLTSLVVDAQDVDTEHVYHLQTRPRPARLVVFDKRPGGVGIAEASCMMCHIRIASHNNYE